MLEWHGVSVGYEARVFDGVTAGVSDGARGYAPLASGPADASKMPPLQFRLTVKKSGPLWVVRFLSLQLTPGSFLSPRP